jgi:hypothetical protein
VRYAMQGQQRRGAGEEERRRDEGTGDRAKEVARTAGGKAAGAWVIGGRGGMRRAMEDGCDGRALRCETRGGYKLITVISNGHSLTDTSFRSGVPVV